MESRLTRMKQYFDATAIKDKTRVAGILSSRLRETAHSALRTVSAGTSVWTDPTALSGTLIRKHVIVELLRTRGNGSFDRRSSPIKNQ